MEKKENQQYFLRVNGEKVPVSKELYKEISRIINHQKYVWKKERKHRIQYYQSWDEQAKEVNIEYLPDETMNTEEQAIQNILIHTVRQYLQELKLEDMQLLKAIYYEERTEKEIAKELGITQQMINKRKKKLLQKLKTNFKNL